MKFPSLVLAVCMGVAIGGGALAAFACGGGDSSTPPTIAVKTPGSGGPANTPGGGLGSSDATKVSVTLKDNRFEPKELNVPAGKQLTFEIKHEGLAIHNMHILSKDSEGKDFLSDLTISPGTSTKFSATFKKKGTVKFQCDYHVPDMVGTITVQ